MVIPRIRDDEGKVFMRVESCKTFHHPMAATLCRRPFQPARFLSGQSAAADKRSAGIQAGPSTRLARSRQINGGFGSMASDADAGPATSPYSRPDISESIS